MDASSRLGGSPTLGSAPPIRTFLIADVRGYTRFTDERGDEAAARLTGSFLSMARSHVESHSGSIVETRGDEILAVFDSAREAIRSAVDLQAALVTERTRTPDLPLNVGIGLDVGEAVPIGSGYRGRALNLAARLCARARPGEILITPELAHLVGSIERIRFERRGAVRLKGFSKSIDLISVSAADGAATETIVPIPGRLTFQLLGPVEVAEDGRPIPLGGPRQRLVLAHLLLAANRVVTIEELVHHVWGTDPPRAARSTIKSYVSHLRRALGTDRIEGRAAGYQLHAETDEIDVLRFEWLVRRARRQLSTEPRDAALALTEALDLWRGKPLGDLAGFPSLAGEITRLEQLRLGAVEDGMAARLAAGDHADALPDLERLVVDHPFHERFWMQLMLARYRSGRQADALEAYRRARDRFADELGIDPGPELQALHERILQQDPGLDLTGRPLRGYRLLEQIGEGAFGVVWRATDADVGRDVAVKQIHPRFADHPGFVRRFEHEAQTVARLEHPHIVPLYDHWRDGTGAYIVMRWMRGGSLEEVVEGGRVDAETGIRMIDQVASALSAAHRLGIVHQDVKPANVLLDEEGNAYLSDFGIAEDITDWRDAVPSSSLGYCSPEQLRGEQATPRSDLYGLGMVLQSLFERQEVPPRARDVIARAVADDPVNRYADAREFAAAVREAFGPAVIRAPIAAVVEQRNPYKGLRPFAEADADDFFGRDALVDTLLARLGEPGDTSRFLAVVGPSGSGKSSIVRAGLVPALRQGALPGSDRWFYTDMLPGPHPLEELGAALLRVATSPAPPVLESLERGGGDLPALARRVLPADDAELLLVIDQFEELFTLVEDESVRTAFLEKLVEAVSDPRGPVRVVVTIRADFFDRPLAHPGLAELFRGRTETVVPLTPEELERAIVGPAERVGVVPELALVAEMIADVSDQPGALPLLQFALTELFERRRDGVLTLEAYRDIEGVSGALARRAEALFERLSTSEREATKQLFLRLVTPGEGVADTRRLVPRSELLSLDVDRSAMGAVIDGFGRHRLLSFDRDPTTRRPTVEVAHEALLGSWDRLRAWIDGARDDLRTHRRLAAAAEEWDVGTRDPSFLLSGGRLEQFEAWSRASDIALTSREREFLNESLERRDAQEAAERERVDRERKLERRSARRMRGLVAVLAVAALVAATLTAVATNQRNQAERARLETRARELAAAADATLAIDPERSILLALEAVRTTRSVDGSVLKEAEEALHRAVFTSRIQVTMTGAGSFVDVDPGGERVVTAGEEGHATIRDMGTGNVMVTLDVGARVLSAHFSPDGALIVTTDERGAVILWDTTTGAKVRELRTAPDTMSAIFDPGGNVVASITHFGSLAVHDVRSGEELLRFQAFEAVETDVDRSLNVGDIVSFSPDGSRLAVAFPGLVASGGIAGRIFDPRTGEALLTLRGDEGVWGHDIDFSPDGSLVATSGPTIDIYDATSGRRLEVLRNHESNVFDVEFGPTVDQLVSASADGTARIWELTGEPLGGQEIATLAGHTAFVHEVAVSSDGLRVVTAGRGTTRVWNATRAGNGEQLALPGTGLTFNGDVEFSLDGSRLVASSGAAAAPSVFDADNGEELFPMGDVNAPSIAISPDGTTIATGRFDGRVILWDAKTGERTTVFIGSETCFGCIVFDTEFSPDGALLATAPVDSTARIMDTSTMQERIRVEHADIVFGVDFSPDGRSFATASFDGTVKVWAVDTGELRFTIDPDTVQMTSVAFSPDGARMATGGFDGWVRTWDATNGEPGPSWLADASGIFDVTFSPDGRLIASAAGSSIELWDSRMGEPRLALPEGAIRVTFDPAGARLASAGGFGDHIWLLEINELVELAEGRVTRAFTADECRQFRIDACPVAS
jgi:WD40 repeat protein/DNA-binding SARP family transcriptional activator/class 3 adenylate cyclase